MNVNDVNEIFENEGMFHRQSFSQRREMGIIASD